MKKAFALISAVLAVVLAIGTIPAALAEDAATTTEGLVVYENDFSADKSGLIVHNNTSYTTNERKDAESYMLLDSATGAGYQMGFGTNPETLQLMWGPDRSYKFEIDWETPEGFIAGADATQMYLTVHTAVTDPKRVEMYDMLLESGATANETKRATYAVEKEFNGGGWCSLPLDQDTPVRVSIVTNNLKTFKIHSFKITETTNPDAPVVVVETDFSEDTDKVVGVPPYAEGFATYTANVARTPARWESGSDTAVENYQFPIQTDPLEIPLRWNSGKTYKIEFDWSLPYGMNSAGCFRFLIDNYPSYAYEARATDILVTGYEDKAAGTTGTYSEIIDFNGNSVADAAITKGSLMTLRWYGFNLQGFTISNLKITDMTEGATEKKSKVILEEDFEGEEAPVTIVTGITSQFSSFPTNEIKDGKWVSSAPSPIQGYNAVFGFDVAELPMLWGGEHAYRIKMDWELPQGKAAGQELMLMVEHYADAGTRGYLVNIVDPGQAFEAGSAGTYDQIFQFSGTGLSGSSFDPETDNLTRVYVLTKDIQAVAFDNIQITDLNYVEPAAGGDSGDGGEGSTPAEPVDVSVRIVDGDGKALASQWIKMDTGEMLQTDSEGVYTFNDLEVGAHTVNLVDSDGNQLGQAYFTILAGEATDINGNFVTIDSTVTALTVLMSYTDDGLYIEEISVGAYEGGSGNAGSDNTDNNDAENNPDAETDGDGDTDADLSGTPNTNVAFPAGMIAVALVAGAVLVWNMKRRSVRG